MDSLYQLFRLAALYSETGSSDSLHVRLHRDEIVARLFEQKGAGTTCRRNVSSLLNYMLRRLCQATPAALRLLHQRRDMLNSKQNRPHRFATQGNSKDQMGASDWPCTLLAYFARAPPVTEALYASKLFVPSGLSPVLLDVSAKIGCAIPLK